ncbi:MAG: hypothetical protein GKS01_12010 [Alphaproteobacteria bacterium]|nr:hypothetical protein [Alphaproteobacteria bacterium]
MRDIRRNLVWRRKFAGSIRFFATNLWDSIVAYIPSLTTSKVKNKDKNKKKLLLVRVDAIGDFVLWLDCFRRFRQHYPKDNWEITLVGNSIWRDLAEPLRYADRYWFVDVSRFRNHLFYRRGWLKKIRSEEFDVAISPVFSRRTLTSDSLAGRSGAKERIAFSGDLSNATEYERKVGDRWFSRIVPAREGIQHELVRNAEFMQGITGEKIELGIGRFEPGPLNTFLIPDSQYFIVAPGANDFNRAWPVPRFAELLRYICKKTGWVAVIVGGEAEINIAADLASSCPEISCLNYTGKTSLNELLGLLRGAALCLSNESMLVHIAAALNVNVVSIVGGGHWQRFIPYPPGIGPLVHPVVENMSCFGCGWNCRHDEFDGTTWPCIKNVRTVSVYQVIDTLIASD